MSIATLKSSYNAKPRTYEDSVNEINTWHKRINIILILGTITISLVVLGKIFFQSPPKYIEGDIAGANSFKQIHNYWVNLEVTCLMTISAIICGWLGTRVRAFNAFLAAPKTQSEQDYKPTLKTAIEEIDENNNLINQQKRFAAISFSLFLGSHLMIFFL